MNKPLVKKILRWTMVALIGILLLAQFLPGTPNISDDHSHDLQVSLPMSDSVHNILSVACYDCHSNNTRYPWYSRIQPVRMWMDDHIEEGKHELNFSEFSRYPIYRQYRKLLFIDTLVQNSEMPIESYTLIHRDAKLDEHQKATLHSWVVALCDTLRHRYPPDSLQRPRRR